MKPILSRAEMQRFDRKASEQGRVPSLLLMENAGRGAAEIVAKLVGPQSPARVAVVCGTGNNGGDGFVVARRLLVLGCRVEACLVGDASQLSPDARVNLDAWVALGGTLLRVVNDADVAQLEAWLGAARVLVDGLFGTGLTREVRGLNALVIEAINRAAAERVALDLPSGLHADSGATLGVAVRAQHTLTFGHPKLGVMTTNGAALAGRLHVVDIGVPAQPCDEYSAEWFEPVDAARHWFGDVNARRPSHKGAAGRVVVVAGAPGTLGAALLTAEGALRAGAGVVSIVGFPETCRALDQRVLEVMTLSVSHATLEQDCERALATADALAIGPGVGLDDGARRLVARALAWSGPKVLDADGLTHFAGSPEQLQSVVGPLVLTPHPGELGRLLGKSSAAIELDRWSAAAEAASRTRATVLLKGPRTLIATATERPLVNSSGCAALATAGAGDVLSGVVAALLCRLPAREAAACAAYVHGRAAELWTLKTGAPRGLLAREVASLVPDVVAELARDFDALPL